MGTTTFLTYLSIGSTTFLTYLRIGSTTFLTYFVKAFAHPTLWVDCPNVGIRRHQVLMHNVLQPLELNSKAFLS